MCFHVEEICKVFDTESQRVGFSLSYWLMFSSLKLYRCGYVKSHEGCDLKHRTAIVQLPSYPGHMGGEKIGLVSTAYACAANSTIVL